MFASAKCIILTPMGLVPAIRRGTNGRGDGRDTPGHDVLGTVPSTKVFFWHARSLTPAKPEPRNVASEVTDDRRDQPDV